MGRGAHRYDMLQSHSRLYRLDRSSTSHGRWREGDELQTSGFTTTTTYPHLPFEDNTFDLIYSGSVFTHIADLGDAWLLELRRILCRGGRLYITVHDQHTIEILRSKYPDAFLTRLLLDHDQEAHFIGTRYRMVSLKRSPQAAMVFYHRDYLTEYWGRELKLLSITPEAYGFQSAVLLSK